MAKQKRITFDSYYQEMYRERWPELRNAFQQENALLPLKDGLKQTYYLDQASTYPPAALEVSPGDRVLDMCAAPGGKTLLLALALGGDGELVANDRSSSRRKRLITVLDQHLPSDHRRVVIVTGHDASKWGLFEQNAYDKILLDAPCSSERHILNSPKHLNQWSPARSRQLTVRQIALACAAADAAKPGGRIIYSTCSISPGENDGIIRKLLKKRPGMVKVGHADIPPAEQTEYGYHLFPDKCGGLGPIYLAVIDKVTDKQKEQL